MNKAILLNSSAVLSSFLIDDEVIVTRFNKTLLPKFKVYLYKKNIGVFGEFVCSKQVTAGPGEYFKIRNESKNLDPEDICCFADGKRVYGWKISKPKIYDETIPINKFKRYNRTEENAPCAHVHSLYPECSMCKSCNLKNPPKSFIYVEELEDLI